MYRPASIETCCPRVAPHCFGICITSLPLQHLERTAAYSFACIQAYEASKERHGTGSRDLTWAVTDRVVLAATGR